MMKLLKDFPKNEWMEAADGCQYCEAKYKVMVTWVDETNNFGDIMTQIKHKKTCPEQQIGKLTDHDIAGWEFMDKPVKILGKNFYPLKSKANIGPCLNCGKLVVGVPFILFVDQGKAGELDFCFQCARKLGLFDKLKMK